MEAVESVAEQQVKNSHCFQLIFVQNCSVREIASPSSVQAEQLVPETQVLVPAVRQVTSL